MSPPPGREEFEKELRAKEKKYHIHHEFHVRMDSGELDRDAVMGWVANRFYYQVSIPMKDAAVLANCPLRDVRRHWAQRIIDHDGTQGDEGGIEAWLQLGDAVGLEREDFSRTSASCPEFASPSMPTRTSRDGSHGRRPRVRR